MEEIVRMQNNLLLIRRAVGWTAEEFGDRIGVTRQTINNIESRRNKLTKTQYIAMRSVLDAEMAKSPDDTEMLRLLLDMLVDHPEKYTEKECQEVLNKANLIMPSILAGTATRKTASAELIATASMIAGGALAAGIASLVATPVAGGMASTWLLKTLTSKNPKKK